MRNTFCVVCGYTNINISNRKWYNKLNNEKSKDLKNQRKTPLKMLIIGDYTLILQG